MDNREIKRKFEEDYDEEGEDDNSTGLTQQMRIHNITIAPINSEFVQFVGMSIEDGGTVYKLEETIQYNNAKKRKNHSNVSEPTPKIAHVSERKIKNPLARFVVDCCCRSVDPDIRHLQWIKCFECNHTICFSCVQEFNVNVCQFCGLRLQI